MTCPSCGSQVHYGHSFCTRCGKPVAAGAARVPQSPAGVHHAATGGGGGSAIAGFILGLFSLLAWLLPIVGLPVSIAGLVFGIKGTRSESKVVAIIGIVLCVLGLVLSIANAAIGAYLGATGQL